MVEGGVTAASTLTYSLLASVVKPGALAAAPTIKSLRTDSADQSVVWNSPWNPLYNCELNV